MTKGKINTATIASAALSLIALIIFILNGRELSKNHMLAMVVLQLIPVAVSYFQIKKHQNVKLNILVILIALSPWIFMLLILIGIFIFKPSLAP